METTTAGAGGVALMFVPLITFAIITGVLIVIPFWRIFSRAGFSGALSLLMFIPGVNVAMLFFLAFARWPKVDGAAGGQGRN